MDNDTSIPPCIGCGACCRGNIRVDLQKDAVPPELTKPTYEGSRFGHMLLHPNGPWCAALDLKTRTCTIYDRRPRVCQTFERGGSWCEKLRQLKDRG